MKRDNMREDEGIEGSKGGNFMGGRCLYKCKNCNKEFEADTGGGFIFHLLRCSKCGKTKEISCEKIDSIHQKYLLSLKYHENKTSSDNGKLKKEQRPDDFMSREQYEREIEKYAGKCRCRGEYKFDAPVRCPQCKSIDIEPIKGICDYD